MIFCKKYTPDFESEWNVFVEGSKSPLFFFNRTFMGYHADRFEDSSLMLFDDDKLVAVLPASRHGNELISHGGLTYGGLLISQKARSTTVLNIFDAIKTYCIDNSIDQLIYKAIPAIYHNAPNQEDLYGLVVNGASLIKRELSSAIDLNNRPKLSKGRKWLVNKAKKENVLISSSNDWDSFHGLLSDVLLKYGTQPTHSVAELEYLSSKFPDNIELHVAIKDDQLLAATLLFRFGSIVHTQYMATSDAGKELGALDLLIETCIQQAQLEKSKYFSFGISTEQGGKVLNEGLVAQKEAFGARAVVLDTYCLDIKA